MQEDERDSAAFRPGYVCSTTSYNPCFILLAFSNIRDNVNVIVLLTVVGGDHSRITLRGLRRLDGMKSWVIHKFV